MPNLTFKKIEGITAGEAFTVNAFANDKTVEAIVYFEIPYNNVVFTKFTPKINSVKVGGQNWLSTEIIKITYEMGIINQAYGGFATWNNSYHFPAKSHQVSEKDGTVSSSVSISSGGTTFTFSPTDGEYIAYKIKIESTQNLVGCKVVMSGFELSAEYTVEPNVITLKSDPTDGGTVTGGGSFDYGATTTLKATPNNGYVFKRWEQRGISVDGQYPVLSTAATYTLTVDGTHTYTAVFEYVGINNIYVGTSKPSKIYFGTQEVKEVYVGTTKVYG